MSRESILVTGATGFIGKHLVTSLLNEGLKIYALTHRANCDLAMDKRIQIIRGDITEGIEVPAGVTTVYHCAGVISQKDRMEQVNVHGTQRIVEAALEGNCRLIHLSSAGVVGRTRENHIDEDTECHPQNLYEQTKLEAEKIIEKGIAMGLKAQILRPTIVVGAGRDPAKDSFLQLVIAMKSGHYKNIHQGSGIYNIVHVNEVVRAMRALDDDNISNGGIYFINAPVTFKDMCRIVRTETAEEACGVPNIPYLFALMAAITFSGITVLTNKKMPLSLSRLRALTNQKVFSQRRLVEKTQYRPLCNIESYIRQTCQEFAGMGLLD